MERSATVHIHPNQINPNAQLNAVYDLQKLAAKRETDRVRKKLLNCASEIEADSDSFVPRVGAKEESEEQPKQPPDPQNQPAHGGGNGKEGQAGAEETNDSISGWA
jgi:hypothetical protein